MSRTKIFYIPGWASGRSGDCGLLDLLLKQFEVEVLWLPDYADPDWAPDMPAERLYRPSLLRRLESENGPVALIGWSTGGMAALELAAASPSRLTGLVFLSSTARFPAGEAKGIGSSIEELDRLRVQLSRTPEKALRRFFLTCYHPAKPAAVSVDAMVRRALDASPEQLAVGLDYLRTADLSSLPGRISTPALVFHGDQDAVIPVEAGRRLCAGLPAGQMHTIIGAGHLLPDCSDPRIVPLIADFLNVRPNPLTYEPGTITSFCDFFSRRPKNT